MTFSNKHMTNNANSAERTVVPVLDEKERVDHWLSSHYGNYSRAYWQRQIKTGHVLVNGEPCRNCDRLCGGESVTVQWLPPEETALKPEKLPLSVVFEDASLLVIDKPPGMVVHPAPGHTSGTLVNALLYHCDDLQGIGGELRPGIVHRLDKDTSGIMVVAKSAPVMEGLQRQFHDRETRKEYRALAWGTPTPRTGRIDAPIGRSSRDRKKMSVAAPRGRSALTEYELLEELPPLSLLAVRIRTGRTHQIRVHLSSIGHPVAGDAQYGGRSAGNRDLGISRQMLHAYSLSFIHPQTKQALEFTAPLPQDMIHLIQQLRKKEDTEDHGQARHI